MRVDQSDLTACGSCLAVVTVVVTGALEAGQGQLATWLTGVLTLGRVRSVVPGTERLARHTAGVLTAGGHLHLRGLLGGGGDDLPGDLADLTDLRADYGARPHQEDCYEGHHWTEQLTDEHDGEELE